MSVNSRIQWFHKKIIEQSYPNAKRLSERFDISHRQAQRDVNILKNKLCAPLEYDFLHKGFYYTSEYTLPLAVTTDNDEDYTGMLTTVSAEAARTSLNPAEDTIVQVQLPYSATLGIKGKLAVVELKPFLKEKNIDGTYLCEFHSIEKFMGIILAIDADITILKPQWLRTRLIRAAERVIRNNKE